MRNEITKYNGQMTEKSPKTTNVSPLNAETPLPGFPTAGSFYTEYPACNVVYRSKFNPKTRRIINFYAADMESVLYL